MATTSGSTTTSRRRHPVQVAAMLVGAVFLLVGILGFVPGITTNYDQMALWGPGSGALLLGLFNVSVLHNIVHLLFGVGIPMARTAGGAKKFLIGSGIIYAVLTVYGFLIPRNSVVNFPPINQADNWLHLALAAGLLALGFGLGRNITKSRPAAR